MINNLQDLFIKYKSKINSKKETEENFLNLLKKETGLDLKNKNLKVDQKSKTIKIINLDSSKKFIFKIKTEDLAFLDLLKKEIGYKIIF